MGLRWAAPFQYEANEEVVLWMNTVGPYHNRQETYSYFSLPFCRGNKAGISHYHETIGEALQGVELEFSGLDIQFGGESLLAPSAVARNVTPLVGVLHLFYWQDGKWKVQLKIAARFGEARLRNKQLNLKV